MSGMTLWCLTLLALSSSIIGLFFNAAHKSDTNEIICKYTPAEFLQKVQHAPSTNSSLLFHCFNVIVCFLSLLLISVQCSVWNRLVQAFAEFYFKILLFARLLFLMALIVAEILDYGPLRTVLKLLTTSPCSKWIVDNLVVIIIRTVLLILDIVVLGITILIHFKCCHDELRESGQRIRHHFALDREEYAELAEMVAARNRVVNARRMQAEAAARNNEIELVPLSSTYKLPTKRTPKKQVKPPKIEVVEEERSMGNDTWAEINKEDRFEGTKIFILRRYSI